MTKMTSYLAAREFLRPFLKFFFRYKVENKENIPKAPYIACANHVALRDACCVACCLPGPMRFMAKSDLKKNRLVGAVLKFVKVIFVSRSQADLGSIRQCVETVKDGINLGIFPQGTRVREKAQPEQAQEGIAMICSLTKVPVLPVALIYKSLRPRLFSRCRVVIGKPIYPEEYKEAGDRAAQSRYIFGKVCELVDNG